MATVLNDQDLSIVVPLFNEESGLTELIKRLEWSCGGFRNYQIILVDDGSSDGTWKSIEQMARCNSRIVGIRLSRNFGHQKAVLAGLSECVFENVGIIDGDLQDPPELFVEMVQLLRESNVDIVYGQRISREGESIFKKATASIFYHAFSRIVSFPLPINVGDFRVCRGRTIKYVLQSNDPAPFIRGIFAHLGFSSLPFPYARQKRFSGKTKYNFSKMFRFATNAIFGFSDLPYRLFLRLALFSMLLAFISSGYAIYHSITVGSLPGWVSLFLLNLYTGSLNFLFLALIAKYLTLNYEISISRPRWVVSERIN